MRENLKLGGPWEIIWKDQVSSRVETKNLASHASFDTLGMRQLDWLVDGLAEKFVNCLAWLSHCTGCVEAFSYWRDRYLVVQSTRNCKMLTVFQGTSSSCQLNVVAGPSARLKEDYTSPSKIALLAAALK